MFAAFRPPRRHEDCRICQELEKDGDTRNIYDDHLHSYPSGCPRYIQMTMKERVQICKRAKICLSCHDPDYIYKMHDNSKHDCPAKNGKKGRFTCTVCNLHMWVCETHKEDNKQPLEKFKDQYRKNFNIDLGLTVTGSAFAHISPFDGENSPFVKSAISMNTSKPKDRKNLKNKDATKPDNTLNSKNISTTEATRMLQRKLSNSGENIELRPIPLGRAQFMIGQTRGKTGPLNILYDSGCYALLLREGVQNELGVSILKTKGPFLVNGVGNTSVKVNDEWHTSLPLIDGSRQAVEGWTVDEVTAPLPRIDLTRAVEELKSDDEENSKLQSMFVERVTGGQVDILLGLMYKAIFPTEVHSLPSGLTIYELQVASHDNKVNSVIGGPHESFEYIAQQVGGASLVFAHLMERLESYKDFGPPSITKSIMSVDDKRFAVAHKEWDEELLDYEDIQEILMENEETSDEEDTKEYDDQSPSKENDDQSSGKEYDDQSSSRENDDQNDSNESDDQPFMENSQKILDDKLGDEETSHVCAVCSEIFSTNGCGPSASPGIFFPDGCGANGGARLDSVKDPVEEASLTESGTSTNHTLFNYGAQNENHTCITADNEDESIKALKKLQHSHEGMQIEYRCPRCRDCNACKRSFETERVSLREEAEDSMIHDSITIDFEKNMIVCSL